MQLFYFAREKIRHISWNLNEYIQLTDKGIDNKTRLTDNQILTFIDENDDGWILLDEVNIH